MLRPMSLVGQWERIQSDLPAGWAEARLALRLSGDADATRAAALLGPLMPGRVGREFRLYVTQHSAGPSARALERTLVRLDDERISGELELLAAEEAATSAEIPRRQSLADAWDALLTMLPPDWSDLYAEVELTSSDHLDPAALALSPLNPSRYGDALGFRFRCAREFGYGASPGMVRRCLERLDEQAIPGEVRILLALSDTKPVGTQGPVWYAEGKVV
jgi:hypothetical protein